MASVLHPALADFQRSAEPDFWLATPTVGDPALPPDIVMAPPNAAR